MNFFAFLFGGPIDISPITNSVITGLGTVLTVFVGWAGWYVKNWVASKVDLTNTQMDEQLQQMFNEYAARAIAYAESSLKGAIPTKVEVDDPFVSAAAGYLTRSWPDFVKRVGMTPERIRDAIIARLPSGKATDKADAIVIAKAAGPATTVPKQ